ncbi:hypothetical protein AB995_2124 [Lactococcus cremoris]|nr:hypothetical protein AB995_2124 [Lactococcus cremoris]KZK42077.1 hypothetical protein LMG6897_0828 [Lactococcus cremoris]
MLMDFFFTFHHLFLNSLSVKPNLLKTGKVRKIKLVQA